MGEAARVASILTGHDSADIKLARACAELVRATDTSLCCIFSRRHGEPALSLQAHSGPRGLPPGLDRPVPLDDPGVGRVFVEGLPWQTDDYSRSPLCADRAWAQTERLESFAAVPLVAGDEHLGVVAVWSPRPDGDQLVGMLSEVAPVLALGLGLQQAQLALRGLRGTAAEFLQTQSEGSLLAGVAHHLHNLFHVMQGHVNRLKAGDPTAGEARQSIETIGHALTRAAEFARNLTVSSGARAASPSPVALSRLVLDALDMIGSTLPPGIEVDTRLDSRSCVRADRPELEQMVINLVLNARDAMRGGGRLTLATEDVVAAAGHPQSGTSGVMLSVSDTGCGLPDDLRANLFRPFVTTKEPGAGAGLGLATVHGIVRRAGGWMEMDSQEGVGTSFRVWLPRVESCDREEGRSPRASLQAALVSGPPARILVVDDADEAREIVARVLVEAGFSVELASTARAALQVLEGPGPRVDLLLTDVVLPDLSGIELARQVPAGTRVLLMTGYSQEAVAQYGPTEHGLVLKPIRAQSLIQRIRYELQAATR